MDFSSTALTVSAGECLHQWVLKSSSVFGLSSLYQDKEPRGIIPLENLSIREVEDPRKPVGLNSWLPNTWYYSSEVVVVVEVLVICFSQNCFELYIPNNRGQLIKACKTEADGRVVEGNHMVYRISAPTPEEKDEWIHSIKYVHRWRTRVSPHTEPPLTRCSSVQICCQCGSLLRNAGRQEETYLAEEEGGAAVNVPFTLPVFLCPSHSSFQHRWVSAPCYLSVAFIFLTFLRTFQSFGLTHCGCLVYTTDTVRTD